MENNIVFKMCWGAKTVLRGKSVALNAYIRKKRHKTKENLQSEKHILKVKIRKLTNRTH